MSYSHFDRSRGFTLIEIVMVLVLLGILAAVAVPKYFDLQRQAQKKVAETIGQEFQARLNASFAQKLLEGTSCQAIVGTDRAAYAFVSDVFLKMYGDLGGGISTGGKTNGVGIQFTDEVYVGSKFTREVYFADSYDQVKPEDIYHPEIHLPLCSNSGSGS